MITLDRLDKESAIENVSRRSFLQGALSASAFVLCVRTSPLLAKAARNGAPVTPTITTGSSAAIDATTFHPGVYVGIQTDGTVLIVAHRTEMGNGVRTSLPTATSGMDRKIRMDLIRCANFSIRCAKPERRLG